MFGFNLTALLGGFFSLQIPANNANPGTDLQSMMNVSPTDWHCSMSYFHCLFSLCLLASGHVAFAISSVRDQEIAQCLPGEITTWGDGQDRAAISSPILFVYQHASSPVWFDQPLVMAAIQRSAQAWSQCGIASRVTRVSNARRPTGSVLIQWSEEGSRGNFGLANLGDRTLSLGPAAFQMLQTRRPDFDARSTLQMVISHEMGHIFGVMSHSRRCVDVTSYYNNGQGDTCHIRGGEHLPRGIEYRSDLPTACDIERCRKANQPQ